MISVQVLQEFYVNITRKILRPLTPAVARGLIENYCAWQVVTPTTQDVLHASEIQERNSLSFQDAMIIVSASNAGPDTVISEDLSAWQSIEGMLIHNPFIDQGESGPLDQCVDKVRVHKRFKNPENKGL